MAPSASVIVGKLDDGNDGGGRTGSLPMFMRAAISGSETMGGGTGDGVTAVIDGFSANAAEPDPGAGGVIGRSKASKITGSPGFGPGSHAIFPPRHIPVSLAGPATGRASGGNDSRIWSGISAGRCHGCSAPVGNASWGGGAGGEGGPSTSGGSPG